MYIDILSILIFFSSIISILVLTNKKGLIKPGWIYTNLLIWNILFLMVWLSIVTSFKNRNQQLNSENLSSAVNGVIISSMILSYYIWRFKVTKKHLALFFVPLAIFLNALVQYKNDGFMPVDRNKYFLVSTDSEEKIEKYIKNTGRYKWIDENTRLWFLSDCILIPGLEGVCSIGDIFAISFPFFILIRYGKRKNRWSRI